MKNLYILVTVAVCGLFVASSAFAAQKHVANHGTVKAAPAKTASDDFQTDLYTKRGVSGVLALENLHNNGSTCMMCSNGIYGTGGTHNMRSNEY